MKNLKFMLSLVICFMLSPAVFALNDETKELKIEIEVVDFEKQASQDAAFESNANFNFDVKILKSFGLDQLQPTQKTQLIKFEMISNMISKNQNLLNKQLTNSEKNFTYKNLLQKRVKLIRLKFERIYSNKLKNLKAINSRFSLIHIDPGLRK